MLKMMISFKILYLDKKSCFKLKQPDQMTSQEVKFKQNVVSPEPVAVQS